jgi:hypothetical protein
MHDAALDAKGRAPGSLKKGKGKREKGKSEYSPGTDKPRRPVTSAETFHPHDTGRTWRVYELVPSNCHSDVCGTSRSRGEEHEVAGLEIVCGYVPSASVQVQHRSWDGEAMLAEDVFNESTAVKAARIGSAIAVRAAAEVERRSDDGVSVRWERCARGCYGDRLRGRRTPRSAARGRERLGNGAGRGASGSHSGDYQERQNPRGTHTLNVHIIGQ